jgi:hypothetical protein
MRQKIVLCRKRINISLQIPCFRKSLTCFISESVIQASRSPHQLCAPLSLFCTMPPHHTNKTSSNEADIVLALSSINAGQIKTTRRAATTFSVPKSTLIDRRAGKPARRDCQPNSKKLTQQEEQVIVSYILDLDQRGFAPTYAAVRDMADRLLAARGAG